MNPPQNKQEKAKLPLETQQFLKIIEVCKRIDKNILIGMILGMQTMFQLEKALGVGK